MIQYTRKKLADKLGIGIEALRYYEKMDLIPAPQRAANGYRIYTEEDFNKINHLLAAKKFGFSLKEIKAIMDKIENTELKNEEIELLFSNKIKDIDNQMIELGNLKDLFLKYINSTK